MRFTTSLGLAASIAGAQAVLQGFNYGALNSANTANMYADYKALFSRAQNLEGTSGFTSARLYTMIQADTTDDMSQAFQAAIDTKTSLLLGVWASAGQTQITNEINALKAAIQQLGDKFTSLVVGISVGSEDLYRETPTGIQNNAGIGASPDDIVSYIKQVKGAIAGTALSGTSIGHVDTWTAWQNSSNSAVIDAVDWLGMDTYPYFQTTVANSIENGNQTFWDAYDVTQSSGNGKEVWITETGWPVSGDQSGQAVASVQNAELYWQEVGCALFGQYNTWWFTLDDSIPTTPDPSFGLIGSNLNSQPLYDLKCNPKYQINNSTSTATTKTGTAGGHATGTAGGNHNTASASASATGGNSPVQTGSNANTPGANGGSAPSASASATGNSSTGGASQASSAIGAGILAIFALVATL